jgi:hypothetical protein
LAGIPSTEPQVRRPLKPMKLFKLDRGESCSNYYSDNEDWNTSAFFINIDHVVRLETRQSTNSIGGYVHFSDGSDLAVTSAAFERIKLAIESK